MHMRKEKDFQERDFEEVFATLCGIVIFIVFLLIAAICAIIYLLCR